MTLSSSPKCPHLLMIPFTDKGHIAPMMNLGEKLASEGLYITVIFTEASSVKDWSSENIHTMLLEKEPHGTKAAALESLIDTLNRSDYPPTAAIVDIIVRWSKRPIETSKLPRYVVYTASCMNLCNMLDLPLREAPVETPPVRGATEISIEEPEMPPMDGYDWKSDLLDSQGILVNSSCQLEKEATNKLQAALDDKGISVFPVGPLVPLDPDKSKSNVCEKWLDEQQPGSVLYISFGSRVYLLKEQIVEVANGLERSGQPFLWVLRVPPDSGNAEEYLHNVLPEGFRSKRQRGLVICNWVPQKMILQHRSVFGFVTHCGWNSVLESIYLAGKPMLCCPFWWDQPVNSRFLVDELQVAFQVEMDQNGIVSSEEFERKIKVLVKDEEMRNRMSEVRSRLLTDESSRDTLSRFARKFYN